jgi:hypothetical protein
MLRTEIFQNFTCLSLFSESWPVSKKLLSCCQVVMWLVGIVVVNSFKSSSCHFNFSVPDTCWVSSSSLRTFRGEYSVWIQGPWSQLSFFKIWSFSFNTQYIHELETSCHNSAVMETIEKRSYKVSLSDMVLAWYF